MFTDFCWSILGQCFGGSRDVGVLLLEHSVIQVMCPVNGDELLTDEACLSYFIRKYYRAVQCICSRICLL